MRRLFLACSLSFCAVSLTLGQAHNFITYSIDDGLPQSQVTAITQDDQGYLWIGTNGGGLARFDGITFKTYTTSEGLLSNRITGLKFAGDRVLVATEGGVNACLLSKDLTRYSDSIISLAESAAELIEADSIVVSAEISWPIRDVLVDREGRTWYATEGGLYSGSDRFTLQEGLPAEMINCLFQDREDNIWIGTDGGGLVKYRKNNFVRFPIRKDRDVNLVQAMAEDSKGNIWIGTMSGLYYFDGREMHPFIVSNIFEQFHINAVFVDDKDHVWYSIEKHGVFRYNGREIDQMTNRDGTISDNVNAIIQDEEGTYWFGTDNGIVRFNDQFQPEQAAHLIGISVTTFAVDRAGAVLIGTTAGVKDVESTWPTNDGLPDAQVNDLLIDGKGTVWVATDNGLAFKKEGAIEVNAVSGFSSNLCYSLTTAPNGHLWIGTNRGVDRLDLATFYDRDSISITTLMRAEGFTGGECRRDAALLAHDGQILFGTFRGIIQYVPGKERPNLVPPAIRITNFSVDLGRYNWQVLASDQLPELPYNSNYVQFDFRAISLTSPANVMYQYMLQGFDEDWLPLTSNSAATYSSLPTGHTYTFKVRARNNSGIWSEETASFTFSIAKPYWEETWFFILIGLITLGSIGLIFYIIFSRQVQRKAMEERIATLQLNALRAQMNPHFIFNALNSIQNFINKNDEESANVYLSKFAALMRLILDNTKKGTIPLSDELKLLDIYLSLEKLRFKAKFDYTITVDSSISTEMQLIPSMLIQPYVENAVNHGLMHKEGKGLVDIRLAMRNDNIHCVIEDNGIGREKAMELKSKKQAHQSAGISITKDRLDILNLTPKGEMSVEITDLYDDSGEAAGTRVEIVIPGE
jgi:streptogramin lyase